METMTTPAVAERWTADEIVQMARKCPHCQCGHLFFAVYNEDGLRSLRCVDCRWTARGVSCNADTRRRLFDYRGE